MTEIAQTGQNLQRMATVLLEAFNDHRLELYPEGDLHRDLTRLRVEERAYGFRLVSPHDEFGHGDTASAFSLAMLAASELAGKKVIRAGFALRGNDDVAKSAFARAWSTFDHHAETYAAEMQRLNELGSDPADNFEWQRAMRLVGRR